MTAKNIIQTSLLLSIMMLTGCGGGIIESLSSSTICDNVQCFGGAKCVVENQNAVCQCPETLQGVHCNKAKDENKCNDAQTLEAGCKNEGICVAFSSNQVQCACPSTHFGPKCEFKKELECSDEQKNQCKNEGTCYLDNHTAKCSCNSAWEGDTCEIPKTCDANPCQNGGICISKNKGLSDEGFSCDCDLTKYKGSTCDVPKTCDDVPDTCKTRGKCSMQNDLVTCNCTDLRYKGEFCQEDFQPFILKIETEDTKKNFIIRKGALKNDNNIDYIYNYQVVCDLKGQPDVITNMDENDFSVKCEYPKTKKYEIAIYGQLPSVHFCRFEDEKIYGSYQDSAQGRQVFGVKQWGDIKWKDISYMFQYCHKFVDFGPGQPDLSEVKNMDHFFSFTRNIAQRRDVFEGDIKSWDVSNIESMEGVFYQSSFNEDISAWFPKNKENKVKSMAYMFRTSWFNSDISNWYLPHVEDMTGMFMYNEKFDKDLSGWTFVKDSVKKCSEFASNTKPDLFPANKWPPFLQCSPND